jgi:hypothetical protein
MHTIYVAGPVLRESRPAPTASELEQLYRRLAFAAEQAGGFVRLPLFDEELERLPPELFARPIWRRIEQADSVIAMIDAPGGHAGSNLSVAGEAHWAAQAGKPLVILAREPDRIPRLLRALSRFPVLPLYGVDFGQLLRFLVHGQGGPASPATGMAL